MGFLAKNDKKSVKIQRAPIQNIIKTPYKPILIGFSPILIQKTESRPIIYKSTKKCPPLNTIKKKEESTKNTKIKEQFYLISRSRPLVLPWHVVTHLLFTIIVIALVSIITA